jgi:cysteine synthase A
LATLNGSGSILDLIGSTPVLKLKNLPGKDDAEVWAKLEAFNPGGSVKDRICCNDCRAH